MKLIDKDFAVKVGGKIFPGGEICKIDIDGTHFSLKCGCETGTDFEITGHIKDLEFLSVPQVPEFKRVADEDKTPNTSKGIPPIDVVAAECAKAYREAIKVAERDFVVKALRDIVRSGG